MSNPRIAIIIGSTRETRFGPKVAQWVFDKARERSDLDVELVDLKAFDLPFFNEVASNMWVPTKDPKAIAWQKKLAQFDGYIFVTPEYNRSVPGALKNAMDQAYVEWVRKAAAYVGYGSVGGARAVEHLRNISVELQMVPVRAGVHVGGVDFFTVSPMGKNEPMSAIEATVGPSVKDMLDQLTWWTNATKTAREATKA